MFFSIFSHKFSYLSIFCHTRLQFAKTSSIHTFFLFLCSRFHKAEITSRRSLYYVRTYLLLRRDVANATSGRIFYSMTTGGNKVTTKTPLIATRYSLIIK